MVFFLINNLQPLNSHLFHKLKDFKGKMVQVSELELGGEFGVQIMELTKSDVYFCVFITLAACERGLPYLQQV